MHWIRELKSLEFERTHNIFLIAWTEQIMEKNDKKKKTQIIINIPQYVFKTSNEQLNLM